MIDAYLARLRAELAGADPAVVQDALCDAEEYLRAEMAEIPAQEQADAMARIEESYGTPSEIASAYLDAETAVTPTPRLKTAAATKPGFLKRLFGVVLEPQAWGALIYMLLALVTGIVYFTIVVTGISLSFGFAILIVGIPFMLLFLAVVRAVSLAEGRLVEALLGERMPRRPRLSPAEGGLLARIKWWLTDYRTWTTMLYMALMLPLGIIYFTLIMAIFSTIFSLVTAPFVQAMRGYLFVVDGFGYGMEPWLLAPVAWAGAVLLFVAMMHGVKAIGKLHSYYAKVMLVGRFSEADQASA